MDRSQAVTPASAASPHPPPHPARTYRCIRQTLYNLSREGHWKEAHGVWFGQREDIGGGDYSTFLSRSTFCFVLPGGWVGV